MKEEELESMIPAIEEDCISWSASYPVDESQTVSNAGTGVIYLYRGKQYEIITWNDRAVDHEPGSKSISVDA